MLHVLFLVPASAKFPTAKLTGHQIPLPPVDVEGLGYGQGMGCAHGSPYPMPWGMDFGGDFRVMEASVNEAMYIDPVFEALLNGHVVQPVTEKLVPMSCATP